jgi:uncharacterized protein involved in exopolysaccharide biosynthesis
MVTVEGRRVMTAREELESLRSEYVALIASLSPEHPDVVSMKKRLDALEGEMTTRHNMRERLRQLREKEVQLDLLTGKFTEVHPDVIRLKKEIALLKEEIEVLSERQTVLDIENEQPENPSYVNLKTQIASTQMEIDTAHKELESMQRKYEDYQRRVENTPQVEQQYRFLERDYANTRLKYEETLKRLLSAREAKGLEKSRMGEKFTMIESPFRPNRPDKPNRMAIVLVGFVLSICAGIGFGSIAEYMDQSVRGADELEELTGHPVLAAIPYLVTSFELANRRRRRRVLALAIPIVIMTAAGVWYLW